MRVAEPTVRRLATDEDRERPLCGWGRIAPSSARLRHVTRVEDVLEALSGTGPARAGLIARGAGRCYGDAAQSAGGEVLDMRGLDRVVSLDRERLAVTAQAGVTIARLIAYLGSVGLTLPVVPGTRYVTVGGALASDVHGKGHHRDGGFGAHVEQFDLCVPGGGLLDVSRENEPELFDATLGGMGLTGTVVQVRLAVEPLASPWVAADLEKTGDLDETLAVLAGHERRRWSVAWLDLLAGRGAMGRALVSRANPWPTTTPSSGRYRRGSRQGAGGALSEDPLVGIPRRFPGGLLKPGLVRSFNAARWHAAPRAQLDRPVTLAGYFFPLDALGSWNRLYGSQGLVQYQFVVPLGQEGELVRCVELLRARRLPVYLAVLKRLGAGAAGALSFPIEGWTLALDIPAGVEGLRETLDDLDELVAGAGGRVYLTKDVRLRKDVLPVMYPKLDRFLALRARIDPTGMLRSDLGARLGLCEATP